MMLIVVLIWGANFSIVKIALDQIPPLVFTALRFMIAVVALLPVLWLREGSLALPRATWWRLIGLGFVGNTLYQISFILGLSQTTAANAALLVATTPAIVALLGATLGVEKITRRIGSGIALALVGVTLVVMARGVAFSWERLRGDLLVLAASVCWAVYTLGVRSLGNSISPLRITTITMAAGLPGLLVVGLPSMISLDWGSISTGAWSGMAYSSLLGLVVAYIVWNTSVQVVGSARTAIYGCAIPLVAVLIAWPLLGERPIPMQAFGAVLIIAGVLLTRRPSGERAIPTIEQS
jgi:drug/metabolite transporter (DMT)-like permease